MQGKSIAECSYRSILQYFPSPLSYHFPLRPLFYLFLSGRLRQVLLFFIWKLRSTVQSLFVVSFQTLPKLVSKIWTMVNLRQADCITTVPSLKHGFRYNTVMLWLPNFEMVIFLLFLNVKFSLWYDHFTLQYQILALHKHVIMTFQCSVVRGLLTLSILATPKCVLLQTVKT